MNIGIVGSEAAKFTPETKAKAIRLIESILLKSPSVAYSEIIVISGGCHLGGIDIWAEEVAERLDVRTKTYMPASLKWSTGYKPRNLAIAQDSDEVHCITVRELPLGYKGMRFPVCCHCLRAGPGFDDVPHIKSGGCWTMHQARKLGKPGYLHVI